MTPWSVIARLSIPSSFALFNVLLHYYRSCQRPWYTYAFPLLSIRLKNIKRKESLHKQGAFFSFYIFYNGKYLICVWWINFCNGRCCPGLQCVHIRRIDTHIQVETSIAYRKPVCSILRRILRQDNINGTIIIRFQTGTVIYAVTINRIINQEVMNMSGVIYLTMDMCSNTLDRIHSWNMIR